MSEIKKYRKFSAQQKTEIVLASSGMGVSMRVARSRELVAQGRPAAVVARVAGQGRRRRPGFRSRGPTSCGTWT